jgi:hypothetical protein
MPPLTGEGAHCPVCISRLCHCPVLLSCLPLSSVPPMSTIALIGSHVCHCPSVARSCVCNCPSSARSYVCHCPSSARSCVCHCLLLPALVSATVLLASRVYHCLVLLSFLTPVPISYNVYNCPACISCLPLPFFCPLLCLPLPCSHLVSAIALPLSHLITFQRPFEFLALHYCAVLSCLFVFVICSLLVYHGTCSVFWNFLPTKWNYV